MADRISCIYCGRFIGQHEFDAGQVSFHFVPDSEFTQEQIDHYHIKCHKKHVEETPEHLRPFV